jgi:hypothetical protein
MTIATELLQLLLTSIPVTLVFFILAVLYKYSVVGDRGKKGWYLIMAGAMVQVMRISWAAIDIDFLGLMFLGRPVQFAFTVISFILVLIGSLKVIIEFFE